jgi:hypothetical protein
VGALNPLWAAASHDHSALTIGGYGRAAQWPAKPKWSFNSDCGRFVVLQAGLKREPQSIPVEKPPQKKATTGVVAPQQQGRVAIRLWL